MNLKTLEFTVESLNRPYKYSWQAFKDDRAVGSFMLPDGWVDLEIMVSHTLSFTHIATIIFSRNTENDDNTSDENFDITGQGDAYRIFATVLKMIEEWIKKYGSTVDIITFESVKKDDPRGSRTKLYHRMAKKFTPRGWKYEKDSGNAGGKAVRFKLINLNPPPRESKYKI